MAWLSNWAKRVKLTIDHTDVNSILSNFPILVYLSTSSGRNNDDLSHVFNKLGSASNRKKIAVTQSDGVTQGYVEIERWDHVSKKAWLWVKVPDISNTEPTYLYLYYDSNQFENNTYVGDSGFKSEVWDSNFKAVWHLNEDPKDGIWEKQGVVLQATGGDWQYAQEPNVLYEGNPQILTEESVVFKMWYRECPSGHNKNRIMYAESVNGQNWTKYSGNPILEWGVQAEACPFVFKKDSTYYMYVNVSFQNKDRYYSLDGINWIKDKIDTLVVGVSGQWDDTWLGNCFVWVEGTNNWYMIYEAFTDHWRLGLATSTDGKSWTKNENNPILDDEDPDGNIGGGPNIHKVGDTYYMWYHNGLTYPDDLLSCGMMRAKSTDLVNWTIYGGSYHPVYRKSEDYESNIADPCLLEVGNEVYLWYTNLGPCGFLLAKANLTVAELIETGEMNTTDSSSGHRNDFASYGSMGSADLIDGLVGKGYNFGTTSNEKRLEVKALSDSELDFTGSFTLEALVKVTDPSGTYQGILSRWWTSEDGTAKWDNFLRIFENKVQGGVSNADYSVVKIAEKAFTSVDWSNIAFVYDDIANIVQVFVDGVGGVPIDADLVMSTAAYKFVVGAVVDTGPAVGWSLGGCFDELRISNTVRNTTWLKVTAETEKDNLLVFGSEEDPPVDYMRVFEETVGTVDGVHKVPEIPRIEDVSITVG